MDQALAGREFDQRAGVRLIEPEEGLNAFIRARVANELACLRPSEKVINPPGYQREGQFASNRLLGDVEQIGEEARLGDEELSLLDHQEASMTGC